MDFRNRRRAFLLACFAAALLWTSRGTGEKVPFAPLADAPPPSPPVRSAPAPAAQATDEARETSAAPARPAQGISPEERLERANGIRSSMKVSLAALYAAQKSFYSEYARYSTDFNALGYSPEDETFRHKTGFLKTFTPLEPTSETEARSRQVSSFDELDAYYRERDPNGRLPFSPETESLDLEDAARFCRKGCTASETEFEILSAANLDDDPELDVWLIDETKMLVHVNDDLAQ